MAEHKIDGNIGAGNVQAPERIWMFAETLKPYISGGGKIMMGDTEYIRADVAAAQLSAANARDAALVEAAGICINAGAYYKNVAVARHRSEMDYSAAEFASLKLMESSDDILALRDKPAPGATEDADGLTGPIEVGDEFIWMPNDCSARDSITVTRVVKQKGRHEAIIWTRCPDGSENWNEESRFREACVRASSTSDKTP